MPSFAEFESPFLGALQQLRSELQGLQGAVEVQLSAWLEHLFRDYLGYSWNDFTRGEGVRIGARSGKQLFPDLRINILDTGLIFIECKRPGLPGGPKGPDELADGVSQLQAYIHAHLDRATTKPKTVLGVVTDGNRWFLMGLNRVNLFHTIAEWAFLGGRVSGGSAPHPAAVGSALCVKCQPRDYIPLTRCLSSPAPV
jgi:hypothetical protein